MRSHGMRSAKAEFADVDFAPIAQALGFEAATVRTMDDLKSFAPALARPEGPILLDCKVNVEVVAPFISEFAGRASGR